MRRFTYGTLAALMVMATAQVGLAESSRAAARSDGYVYPSRSYTVDHSHRVTPRVGTVSQRLTYVDRTTRYDGNVYRGSGNRVSPRVINRTYTAAPTVAYVDADVVDETYGEVRDGVPDRVVVVQPNDGQAYAGYARYKHGRTYDSHRAYGYDQDYRSHRGYSAYRDRSPVYVNVGYSYGYGRGYGYRCGSGYGHHYGHRYSHRYRHGYGRGGYGHHRGHGHFRHHRGGHHSHTGISIHFDF